MARFLMLAVAVATLGAASGAPLPSDNVKTATAGEHSLRGGRKLQEGLCNSIGCPGGYTPIPDAMNVECDDDPCEPSQCCEAFCSYHPCPANYIPMAESHTTLCPDSGCTDALCCVDGESALQNEPDVAGTPSPITILDTAPTGSFSDNDC